MLLPAPKCGKDLPEARSLYSEEAVELRNARSNAEFLYRVVTKRRGFEGKRLEHREMEDKEPNLVYEGI
jgi:hypothetical protein